MSDTTRNCHFCNGAGGAMETIVENRNGQQVVSQTWRQCRSCGGTGKVPA